MRVKTIIVTIIVFALCGLALAGLPKYARSDLPQERHELGLNQSEVIPPVSQDQAPVRHSLDEIVGTADTVGFTWYDEQQWTTFGKQIAVDREGYAHHVWTNGLNSSLASRHVYYNVWDPSTEEFTIPNGSQIDASQKAGYVNVTVNNLGFAFPAFHQILSGDSIAHTAVAYDFVARSGAFTVGSIPNYPGRKIIYPKIVCDIDGALQVTATHGTPANIGFFAKGDPTFSDGYCDGINWTQGFEVTDSTFWLTRDIATSFRSNRVAMVWLYWRSDSVDWYFGKNVYLKTSDDGGLTWNPAINITNYPPIDTNCVNNGGNIDDCNQDTLRPAMDLSVVFDQNDVVHVAFTARWSSYWDETGAAGPWVHNDAVSSIWHWDEQHQEFNIIAERANGTLAHSPGQSSTQSLCQRPSLGIDTTTGYLYCSYQAFDTTQWSEAGYFQGDAWVSVSTTRGRTWSAGTNVTNTNGGQDAPSGQCRSERDINIAEFVGGGIVHMQYQLDLDAGTGINSTAEGTITYNPMVYQRVPTNLVPLRPLMNPYRAFRMDSTGYPRGLDTTLAVNEPRSSMPAQFYTLSELSESFQSYDTDRVFPSTFREYQS